MRKLAGLFLVLALACQAEAQGLSASAQAAISQYRAAHGLSAVKADGRLMALAAEQARAMARTGVMDHSVDRPFAVRIASYDPDVAVENIAAGTTSFEA